MKRVCVYCGSRFGKRESYTQAVRDMGRHIAQSGVGLVYGGASRGLMGVLADAAMEHGGSVIGVIPEALVQKEIANPAVSELKIVPDMHVRKATMAAMADAFIVLPGGAGTLEEFFEMFTWWQLSLHEKPIAILNVDGFFDPLLQLFERTVDEGFIAQEFYVGLLVYDDAASLWKALSEKL